jgi:hypothetical protein
VRESGLFEIFGGKKAMIESPLFQELVGEKVHKYILLFLEGRFGAVPPELAAQVRIILDEDKLEELARQAAACPTLEAFEASLKM